MITAALLVVLSLERKPPAAYAPTPPLPREVGDSLLGPALYTIDARDPGRWVFFDFSRASLVERPGPLDWDLAFRRFHIMANGGPSFNGVAGILDLGNVGFDAVVALPADGYAASSADSSNSAIAKWYDYNFTSHLLTPKRRSYAVRTADGKYAKLELLAYYCPGAQPGCVTFRYTYRGDGRREFHNSNGGRL